MQDKLKLIKANLRLVVKIAHDFKGMGLPLLDLISEGNIGLMRAVDMFDHTQGNRLSTLAVYKIHKQIQRFLAKQQDDFVSLDMEICDDNQRLLLSIEQEEEEERLLDKLKTLSQHEQQVLRLLYGLEGCPEMSYEEVAKHIGIRADSVRRIKMRAMRKINPKRMIFFEK